MVFSSIVFLAIFLPAILALFCLPLPRKYKNLILLLGSLSFYAWGDRKQLVVLLVSIVGNYIFGLWLESCLKKEQIRLSRFVFIAGIFFNVGLLVFFKYAEFIFAAFKVALPKRILPLGLSFFTFQGISYLTDLKRKQVSAERNPLNFALFKSFFPQLIAGPIVRYGEVASQLITHTISIPLFAEGTGRFVLGLAKKVLIANSVSTLVDAIFLLNPESLPASTAWLGALGYTVQIYFDFSGYSDMAVGLGLMFGIRLPENFDRPYAASSVTEFWKRWHQTLSSWFRDYLYIPLGGNRSGSFRTAFNLCLVFLLCGFWHGANWTFLAWGAYHGFFLGIEKLGLKKTMNLLPKPAGVAVTLAIVVVGWVFFRSASLNHALAYLKAMLGGVTATDLPIAFNRERTNLEYYAVGFGLLLSFFQIRKIGAIGAFVLLILSVMQLAGGTQNPFIYFRF